MRLIHDKYPRIWGDDFTNSRIMERIDDSGAFVYLSWITDESQVIWHQCKSESLELAECAVAKTLLLLSADQKPEECEGCLMCRQTTAWDFVI